jgi:transcriptional regulator with XRE-family HTH domain
MNQSLGERIKEKFDEKCRTNPAFCKAEFARRICVHRSTVYNIFNSNSIDINLLRKISDVLEYDFCAEILGHKPAAVPSTPPIAPALPKITISIEISPEQLKKFAQDNEILQAIEKIIA